MNIDELIGKAVQLKKGARVGSKRGLAGLRSRAQFSALEPRTLYSADLGLAGSLTTEELAPLPAAYARERSVVEPDREGVKQPELATEGSSDLLQLVAESSSASHGQAFEIVLIDRQVPDLEVIRNDLQAQIDQGRAMVVMVVDSGTDGINRISQMLSLAGREVTAIHIISHGQDGQLTLGATRVDADTLEARNASIATWSKYLSSNADILLYGCDIANTAKGTQFVSRLGELTGADVAASRDITGAKDLGGNWDLEYRSGAIEHASAVSTDLQIHWRSILPSSSGPAIVADQNGTGDQRVGPVENGKHISVNASGDIVIAWEDSGATQVTARLFHANGSARTAELVIFNPLNEGITNPLSIVDSSPVVAMRDDGTFVVAWVAAYTGQPQQILAQRFTSEGLALGPRINVAGISADAKLSLPDIDLDASGGFVIAYTSLTTTNDSNIYASGFNSDGTVRFQNIDLGTNSAYYEGDVTVAVRPNGDFTVAWTDYSPVSLTTGIYGQRFDSTGVQKAARFLVNTTTQGYQDQPSIESAADGSFAISYTSDRISGGILVGSNILMQRFHADQTTNGSEVVIAGGDGIWNQSSALTVNSGNEIAVVWASGGQADGSYAQIHTQGYSGFGIDGGNPRILASAAGRTFTSPSVASNGNIVVADYSITPSPITGPTNYGVRIYSYIADTAAYAAIGPVNSVPLMQSTAEETTLGFSLELGNAFQISDSDVPVGQQLSVRLSTNSASGLLTINNPGYVFDVTTGLAFTAPLSASMLEFKGSVTQINLALAQLQFTPANNFVGSSAVQITTTELYGSGLTDSDSVAINITAVNDAPTITLPTASLTVPQGSIIPIDGPGFLRVDDVDAATSNITVRITAQHGLTTVAATPGVIATAINTVVGPNTIRGALLSGSLSDINTALQSLTYESNSNFEGIEQISVRVDDKGNTGTGGNLFEERQFDIIVTHVNKAPFINIGPSSGALDEDSSAALSSLFGATNLSLSDIDAGADMLDLRLSVSQGSLSTLTAPAGLLNIADLLPVTGPLNASIIQVRGLLANLNLFLASLQYTPGLNYVGPETFNLSVDDLQLTPQSTASVARSINVVPRNDGPVADIGSAINFANEDISIKLGNLFSTITVSDIDASSSLVEVALTVPSGTLSLNTAARALFDSSLNALSGMLTGASISFRGTVAAVNAALTDIEFLGPENGHGSTYSVTLNVSDLGNTGGGPIGVSTISRTFTVSPVNDPPVINIGSQALPLLEDSVVKLSSLFVFNQLNISDIDAASGQMQFQISVDIGTMSLDTTGLNLTNPLTFAPLPTIVSGTSLSFRGSLAELNAALSAIDYHSLVNSTSDVMLTLKTDDLGNTGGGPSLGAMTTRVLSMSSVNDKPVISLGPQSGQVLEDTGMALGQIFSSINITDIDIGLGEMLITVSASNGTLSLDTTNRGLSNTSGIALSGNITGATLSFKANSVNANDALALVVFTPNLNANGTGFSVTVSADDLGGTGLPNTMPGPTTAIGSINVDAVNDRAVWTLSTTANTVQEDTPTALSTILPTLYVADVDSGSSNILVSITLSQGSLSLDTTGKNLFDANTGLAITGTISGNTLSFQGQKTMINAVLGLVTFTPPANANGSGYTLSFNVADLGNSGLPSPIPVAESQTRNFSIAAVNDAPNVVAPSDVHGIEDLPLSLSSAQGNAIIISDADGDVSSEISLSVTHGSLSLAQTNGLSFIEGDGINDTSLRFTGKLTDITAALDGLKFSPDALFACDASLSIEVNDLANQGSGGAKTAQRDIALHMAPVNNAPGILAPIQVNAIEDTSLVFSGITGNQISISDPDGDVQAELLLQVTHGKLSLGNTTGLVFSQGDGQADSLMRFSGKLSDLNIALNGISFSPDAEFSGLSVLSIQVDDQGNLGLGGAKSLQRDIEIAVGAVNDVPIVQVAKGFSLQGGDMNALDELELLTTDIESSRADIMYTLDAKPTQGALLLNGVELQLGDGFTQADVAGGGIVYKAATLGIGQDQIKLGVRDKDNSKAISVQLNVDVMANPNYTSGGATQGTGSTSSGANISTSTSNTSTTANAATLVKVDTAAKADSKSTSDNTGLSGAPQVPGGAAAGVQASGSAAGTAQNAGEPGARANEADRNNGPGAGNLVNLASTFAQSRGEAPRLLEAAMPGLAVQSPIAASPLQGQTSTAEQPAIASDMERPIFSAQGINLPTQNLSLDRMVADNSFQKNIEQVREDVMQVAALDRNAVVSTIGVSASFTIGYILWLVRGGVLISSLLASLPAWRMVDPLPVLGSLGAGKGKDENDKSLEELVEQSQHEDEATDQERLAEAAA